MCRHSNTVLHSLTPSGAQEVSTYHDLVPMWLARHHHVLLLCLFLGRTFFELDVVVAVEAHVDAVVFRDGVCTANSVMTDFLSLERCR